jgi:HAE1 family hydrophobic/amphiphilic exporter-1
MTLSEICIRRPVFATMLVTACVAVGVLSFGKLGVDQFPDVELPVVTITTTYRGASPEEVETQVTQVIEDAVSTIEGIDELRSSSEEGLSVVTVVFVLDRKRDEATQDVRDKVSTALGDLPEGSDPPVVTRFDSTASPVMTLAVSGERAIRELTEISRERLQEPLQGVSGVGKVLIIGGRTRAIDVVVDADALSQQNVGIEAVRTAIQQQNVEVPGGRVTQAGREETLRTLARVGNARELGNVVVAERPLAPLRLTDIATVEDAEEEPRSFAQVNGRTAVALVIQKQAGSNTVEVVDSLTRRIEQLKRGLPEGVNVEILRDNSRFIRQSIHEVEIHLVLGGILASIAVLVFMGSFRSTVIAAIAIPSSIVATFAILRALDYTLNNFTLLALTLSVGIVIDDAIVVLENIHRHIEEGASPFDAAIRGTKEITLAVVATTLSLIVIFLPTAFMEGRVGRFWRGFGITTAFAIGVSLFISLTLTPMLCSRFLKPVAKGHESKGVVAKLNSVLDNGYAWLVRKSLRYRWFVVLIAVATVASTVLIFPLVGQDFVPQDDANEMSVSLVMPEGSDLSASTVIAREIEGKLRELRGVELVYTTIGSTDGGDDVTGVSFYVRTIDVTKRDYSVFDVQADARRMLAAYPELRPNVTNPGGFGGGGRGQQLSFTIRGPDLERLTVLSEELMSRMREDSTFVDVDSSAAVRKPEIRVRLDRTRAADLGVRAQDVAVALRTMVGGEAVSKFREGDQQYDIWLRIAAEDRDSETTLSALPIQTARGLVRLDSFASIERDRGPAKISRLNRVRQVEIGANLNAPLGASVERVKAIAAQIDMPPGYEVVFGGRAKLLQETAMNFLSALALSFLFMYMVLAAQFESFLHPITIMLSLPLSLPFALLSLFWMGSTLNIYSTFGIFMLFGIVKKNGILQVDFTNVLRSRGIERDEAIVEANKTRLRPILMTTITLIVGMIPIALGKGPGAPARASLANVIIGGQALSLLIALLIVPVAYSLFDDLGAFASRKFGGRKSAPPDDPSASEGVT